MCGFEARRGGHPWNRTADECESACVGDTEDSQDDFAEGNASKLSILLILEVIIASESKMTCFET
jgi:hypothetical protein